MLQFVPAIIMFIFTVAFAGVFLIPATNVTMKTPVLSFYWRGFWIFLAMICAISGSANTLLMAQMPVEHTAEYAQIGIVGAFIGFVILAWVHLAGKAAILAAKRVFVKSSPAVLPDRS